MIENKDLKFTGMGVDLETSLIEYGFVCTNEAKDCDHEKEYFIIYRLNDGLFGTGYREESDLNDSFKELGSEQPFLDHCDYGDAQEFYDDSFVNKLNNLFSYYGEIDIMGIDYSPSEKEKIELLYPQIF